MKIQLIHPPTDKEYAGNIGKGLLAPATHLEILASAIFSEVPDSEITVLDGNIMSLDSILSSLDADLVGVTSWYSSHNNALEILEKAKERKAITIIGGPNVNFTSEQILKNRSYVDYVIRGDGEDAIDMLVRRIKRASLKKTSKTPDDLEKVSNLTYRKGDVILSNPLRESVMNRLFTFGHSDITAYDPKSTMLPISAIRGCIKAESRGRCTYCSMTHRLKIMDPKLVWTQIDILSEMYGFEFFFETGDSFMVKDYPERLLRARPKHLKHIRFRIYASPDQITPESVHVLEELNVSRIFLGVESVDSHVLRYANRVETPEDAYRAVDLLSKTGMELVVAMVYGLAEETMGSLEDNYQFLRKVSEKSPNLTVYASRAIPIVGSLMFSQLNSRASHNLYVRAECYGDFNLVSTSEIMERSLGAEDHFNYQQLARVYCKNFTAVDYELVSEYLAKTSGLVPKERFLGFGDTRIKAQK